jgi:SynChlorMet cassette protein ScmC
VAADIAKRKPLVPPLDTPQQDSKPSQKNDAWSQLGELTGFCKPEAETRLPGFSLRLGDGSCWWIAASPGVAFIAEKLANIMHLQEGDPEDAHLMFFYEKHAGQQRLETPRLQAQGWTNFHCLFSRMCFHPRLRHFLGEYDESNPNNSPYVMMGAAVPSVHWESICRGGLPFHAALLERQGQGVILAAPGATGKSTCSRRVPPPWQARCDDQVLAVLTPQGRYLAHPFPTWTDYLWERAPNTWKVEEAVPLAGIFFFEQAPEDDCRRLEGAAAAVAATSSAEQIIGPFLRWGDAEEARKLRLIMLDNACKIVKQVPVFHLRVSLTGSFWEQIEAALGWR